MFTRFIPIKLHDLITKVGEVGRSDNKMTELSITDFTAIIGKGTFVKPV